MDERDTLLLALFELRITHAENSEMAAKLRLSCDSDAPMFGAEGLGA